MYLPRTLNNLCKFGRAALTGQDFLELCDRNEIDLIMSSDVSRGFYYCTPDRRHTIVLSTSLSPRERRFVGWHEFAHFLQNFHDQKTVAAFSNVEPDKASEKLADVFATIATRPGHVRMCRPLEFVEMIMNGDGAS